MLENFGDPKYYYFVLLEGGSGRILLLYYLRGGPAEYYVIKSKHFQVIFLGAPQGKFSVFCMENDEFCFENGTA